jgi:nucleotide-binding universal stress UspA family protein
LGLDRAVRLDRTQVSVASRDLGDGLRTRKAARASSGYACLVTARACGARSESPMKVLLAVDGSEHSNRAVDFVANAGWLQAGNELVVFTAVAPLPRHLENISDPELVRRNYLLEAEEILAPVRKRLSTLGMRVRYDWATGPAAEAIVRTAEKGQAYLIVMGSHGHGALGNVAMGSVATRVLASCSVPVLLVR